MKKIITTVFCTAIALCSGLNVYAAEILERDYIEAEIWEEMWNGKGDNGLDFPEASYNLYTLFHTLFIALYRHLCYNQDIEQIGGEMQWITKPKN